MKTGQPGASTAGESRLQQVLGFGEDLLALARKTRAEGAPAGDGLYAMTRWIIDAAARLVGGEASLWFTPEFIREWLNPASRHEAEAGWTDQPTALMGRSIEASRCIRSGRSAAAPMLIHDRQMDRHQVIGAIQVRQTHLRRFGAWRAALLEGLAIQAALSLQASLQTAVDGWRLQQLTLVRQVSLEISDLRDLDEITRRITRLIQTAFNYYCVSIFTIEPGQQKLTFRATAAMLDAENEALKTFSTTAIHIGDGLVGYVAQTGEEVVAPDVSREPRYREIDALPEARSETSLPLKVRDRLVGVLDVQSDLLDDFNETDLIVLRALAANIAVAVEDARLYSKLRRRAAQLETLYQVSSAITSILDQEELLGEVARLMQQRFGYPYIHLFSVHPGRRKVFYEAGSGARSQAMEEGGYAYDLDDEQGIIPWVARNGQTVVANDVSQEPRYRPSPLPPEVTRSEAAVPLIFGDQVLGVLDVQSDELNAFTQEDVYLFEALADHIAIALRNAYLYRSEIWRRNVNDNLREVAGLLSADVDLDQVLQAILAVLGRTLPQDLAAIWLLDPTAEDAEESSPALHLAALQGAGTGDLILEVGFTPEEVLEYNHQEPALLDIESASAWLQAALNAGQPIVRDSTALFEPLGAALRFPQDYSAIAAPLRVGNQPLGVLTLAQRSRGRYGSEAIAMSAAFASSAAVAIENARLYEAAHEQAWVSTVLLQVANATQTINNLNELLATVIHITPMLAGVKACLLYILDEDGDFVPAAAYGLSPEGQVDFERWRFAPGDVTALDRLLEEKAPVFLHGGQDDQRLTAILHAGDAPATYTDLRLMVLVPMLARGEVLGAFLVDYSAAPAALSGRSLEAFFDERLAILQGIAHQTAIAVDNIYLLKSQKEEAYVSVALLQVAQAVVSSNDLDEALGSIVRITPILVGVKRAVIYLWDESHKVFRLSQAYGISRDSEALVYALSEFPLLDAVLIENAVLAHPLWSEISASEDAPDIWTFLDAPDLDKVDEYLESSACLLLAFPLAVKGKVLGVMLVEEPDPVPGEAFSSVNANRRLRSKRMEIITGISQQAALAIENDLLARETLERERLEREMQLAREIQRAFLPQATPELPGWDLKVLWRTAREVGGDFYDFFELPGNRLGLLIADVADKGMPAALFMTLVRTLVRATVREIDSPAEVLERANDIIVPDSPRGMFVTIFYAVLDLDTGVLEYANAGHNLPLLIRATSCEIEQLSRGGMALGVLEGNRIQEGQTSLHPGDHLVLYTDGVTEAFSPEFEPFGEERLQSTIAAAACPARNGGGPTEDAQALLSEIDGAVESFIGDGPPSDDLTVVVLYRRTSSDID